MVRKAAVPAVIVLVLAACGGNGGNAAAREDPGEFMVQNLKCLVAGQYERAYDGLHPAHQEIVRR